MFRLKKKHWCTEATLTVSWSLPSVQNSEVADFKADSGADVFTQELRESSRFWIKQSDSICQRNVAVRLGKSLKNV